MRGTWQLQEAKNRLSELIRRVEEEGPQTITVRGRPAVVVVRAAEFANSGRQARSIVEVFQASPFREVETASEREDEPEREIAW